MLFWHLDALRTAQLHLLANTLRLTLFEVSKTPDTDRLISWPRAVNQLYPGLPEFDFPDPSLFAQVQSIGRER